MRRSKHSLSHYRLLTCDMAQLVPVAVYDVLPGDTIQQASSCLLRMSPLLAPIMHPITVRLHHWFVPYRLLWAGWEEFITGGADGEGGSSGEFPFIDAGAGFAAGSLADYFGIPPSVADTEVSALPFRAYNLIFNEFYRDQDLVTARAVPTTSGADATSPVTVATVAWEKDYFTAARPWPQKGPDVTLPLGTVAPVSGLGVGNSANTTNAPFSAKDSVSAGQTWNNTYQSGTNTLALRALGQDQLPDVYADLSAATAVSVNTVREAFGLQRFQEARAMYGSRYTEYLKYLGVTPADARLQRPEYLGGGKQTIATSEVLQTAPDTAAGDSEATGVGVMRGHGIAAMRSRRLRRFIPEHGVVITLLSVRPRAMYVDGVHRMWSKRTKEDYFQPELERIGQQEIRAEEVFADAADPDAVFGYGDRYDEYRHHPSQVSGEFRTTLNFWHLARDFAAEPTLNSSFVTCDPSTRIFASAATDSLWIMVNHSIQARRPVGRPGVGRIL